MTGWSIPKRGDPPAGIYRCIPCQGPMSWSQHCPVCKKLRTRIGTYSFSSDSDGPRYDVVEPPARSV